MFTTPPCLRGGEPFECPSIISCLVGSSTLCSMVKENARRAVWYREKKKEVNSAGNLDIEQFPGQRSELWRICGERSL